MKKTEGYIVKRLEDEYLVLPTGKRTEEVNEEMCIRDRYSAYFRVGGTLCDL